MRASLNKLKETEDFLSGSMKPQDAIVFRAKLLLDPFLRMNVAWQKKTYSLIKLYGRRDLLYEISTVQEKIFSDPRQTDFQKKVDRLFPKQ